MCSLLLGPLVVFVSVILNVSKLGGSGTGWKSIFFTLLIMSLESITFQSIASKSVGYIMHSCTQSSNCLLTL